MPAFRLVLDSKASAAFRTYGSFTSSSGLDSLDFEAEVLPPELRRDVQNLNMKRQTAVLLPRQVWKAAFFDMDSTVIEQESIVELARAAGKEEEVAAITERAMAGELDFAAALKARVLMLKGISSSVFQTVAPRLRINPGMDRFASWAKQQGMELHLVSGGFNPLARVIAEKLGFTAFFANELEEQQGQLSGRLVGTLVDAEAKANYLRASCAARGFAQHEVIAIGDGANDLPMMQLAGASIGYHPKPVLIPHISGANFHDHNLLLRIMI